MINLQKTSNPAPVQVGDSFQFWSNQSPRPARVVAIRDDWGGELVIEYIMPNRRTYLIRVVRDLDLYNFLGALATLDAIFPEEEAVTFQDLKALSQDLGPEERQETLRLIVKPLGRCPAWAREQIASARRADQRLALWDELDAERPMTRRQLRQWERLEREALSTHTDSNGPRLTCEEVTAVLQLLALEIMDGGL